MDDDPQTAESAPAPLPPTYQEFLATRELPREIPPPADLSPDALSRIGALLLAHPTLSEADLLLVVGCRSRDFSIAADAWHARRVKRILCTGRAGETFYQDGTSYAREAMRALCTLGVPEDALFVEETGDNTRDEIRNGLLHVHDQGMTPRSVIILSHRAHTARCRLTVKKLAPHLQVGHLVYNTSSVLAQVAADVGGYAALDALLHPDRWHTHPALAARLYSEYARILHYSARGDIAPPDY